MPPPRRYTNDQILGALRATFGKVYLAAEKLGCQPSTIYRRAENSRMIAETIEHYAGRMLDLAETELTAAIVNHEAWAIRFALQTVGRKRGYNARIPPSPLPGARFHWKPRGELYDPLARFTTGMDECDGIGQFREPRRMATTVARARKENFPERDARTAAADVERSAEAAEVREAADRWSVPGETAPFPSPTAASPVANVENGIARGASIAPASSPVEETSPAHAATEPFRPEFQNAPVPASLERQAAIPPDAQPCFSLLLFDQPRRGAPMMDATTSPMRDGLRQGTASHVPEASREIVDRSHEASAERSTLDSIGRCYWHVFRLVAIAALLLSGVSVADNSRSYPLTKIEVVTDRLHGTPIADSYRWLEDQQSPATRAWIEAQNTYTDRYLKRLTGREVLAHRLDQLLKVDAVGLPVARGTRYFFTKQPADRDLPVICVREGLDGRDVVLIDPKGLSNDGSRTVSLLDVSQDGRLLVYGVRAGGEDELTLRFFDVERRADRPEQIDRGRYFGVSLTPDQKTLYYARHGKEGSRVFRRSITASPDAETLIFGEGYEPGVGITPGLSEDGRFLVIHVWFGSAAKKTEIHVQDLSRPDSPIVPVVTEIEARFSGAAVDRRLFVKTNWKAPQGRILEIDLTAPAQENWKEIIPEDRQAVLEDFSPVAGRLYVHYLREVASQVRVFQPDGQHLRDIAFPALGTVSEVAGEWDRDEAFFSFSSFHIPSTIYREESSTGRQAVWFRSRVPVDSERFEVRQVWFESKDKTRIPMFLVHRKGLVLDGNNPTLLGGYGGFNISLTPQYSSRAVVWIEQGGVYAVANLRGGGEFGENWHEAGMLEHKQNVFDDFIGAAAWLIERKYTRAEKLAIAGRSNGGLLVGAALTQRPDLFQAVVCGYPLLDMVRYHQFLVARFWVPEYGSSEDPEQFRTLLAYSPYHHVANGTKYPAALFVTGDADTRVDPLHARKMTALMQASTGSDRPILLKYDTKLGHTGARPVSQTIEDLTDELGFLFEQLHVDVAPARAVRN